MVKRHWRWVVLLCCGLAVFGAATSLLADSEPLWICCDGNGDCGGRVCCPPEIMGKPACFDVDDHPGYCVAVCIKPGAGR